MTVRNKIALPLLMLGLIIGTGVSIASQSFAQTTTATPATVSTDATASTPMDPSKGGHVGQNGVKEELLTGDTAARVTAAALAAVPGGTIERVETDAEGAAYEAHMTKSDGSHVTVKFDSNFAIIATEDGHGPR